jgi:hypothetical protein
MSDQCLKLDMDFSNLLEIIEGGKHSLEVSKKTGKPIKLRKPEKK